ncbi:cytochrome c peroxidase [Mucilaginibacter sabulilitoris]|uniref:Cytochrome c peroxidase n=1 Tax=Mucilaginibacter sabulilitoris TaxID=1173583 RepID=A0ABZ0TLK8_9SPHI|nr:cytochrome c peroxidase [Mucilaginibacter sabulilitoris]WPU93048.1 cytochrome c peroxidase [Mucilaginibacter sabulilitoris]
MFSSQYNRRLYSRLSKSRVMFCLFALIIILSGWSYSSLTVETGAYNLVYPTNFGNRIHIPADNPTTKQGVYLGRLLFYETKLSANNTLSCSSCHQQDKAFTDGRPFSPGVDHVLSTRNSMSLANLLWARKFFWDGRAEGLEQQAPTPLTNPHEMGQSLEVSAQKLRETPAYLPLFKLVYGDENITGDRIVKAIAQFERTLISANSRYDQYLNKTYQPTADELKGMELFNNAPQPEKGIRGANCAHCHGGVKTYMELFHNNGLDSIPPDAGMQMLTGLAADKGRFKVPTLRNITLTAPYMHDGRFKTLEEVVDHYSEHIVESASLSSFLRGESNVPGGKSLKLLPQEKRQIVVFLNMLTDSAFIHNPEFADPRLLTAKNKKP